MENRTTTVGRRALKLKCLWIDKRKDDEKEEEEDGKEKTAVSSLAQHGTTRPTAPHTHSHPKGPPPPSPSRRHCSAELPLEEEEKPNQEEAATFHDCVTNPGFAHLICCCGWDPGNYPEKKKKRTRHRKKKELGGGSFKDIDRLGRAGYRKTDTVTPFEL